jgi:hypothetical protein
LGGAAAKAVTSIDLKPVSFLPNPKSKIQNLPPVDFLNCHDLQDVAI